MKNDIYKIVRCAVTYAVLVAALTAGKMLYAKEQTTNYTKKVPVAIAGATTNTQRISPRFLPSAIETDLSK